MVQTQLQLSECGAAIVVLSPVAERGAVGSINAQTLHQGARDPTGLSALGGTTLIGSLSIMVLALTMRGPTPVAAKHEIAECFDVVVVGRVERQRFADIAREVRPDTFGGPVPGVVDVEVTRVISGSLSARSLKAHSSVGEYFRKDRLFTLHLRRNTLGEFNWVFPDSGGNLRRCSKGETVADPFVPRDTRLVD